MNSEDSTQSERVPPERVNSKELRMSSASLILSRGRRITRRTPRFIVQLAALCVGLGSASLVRAQGVYIPSVGPVNQSMSGVAAACPIDSIGAINANPATISGLKCSEVAFGLGLVLPTTSIDSSVVSPLLGPLGGSSDSEPGTCSVPTIGFVQRFQGSPWTIGLGMFGVGGFSSNYEASVPPAGNPIFFPQAAGGMGRVYSKGEICQIVPTVSYALSDRFSIGASPILTLATITTDPFFLAPPVGGAYAPGSGTRTAYGAGFQVGAYYIADCNLRFGLSYKSQQWMEDFRIRSETPAGLPQNFTFDLDLPSITTGGVSYAGFERWLFAADVRYFDYANAAGFDDQGFNPDLSVAGIGWDSIFSISQAVQFELTPRLTLRGGYTWNENPVPEELAFFNVASSLIIQHWASVGATFRWSRNVSTTLAYTHGFENTLTGPLYAPGLFPATPIPGSSVTQNVSADIFNFGVTVNY
jgi:long-chain fatty acid transport protein